MFGIGFWEILILAGCFMFLVVPAVVVLVVLLVSNASRRKP
jgi:hypothetical protein